MPIITYDSSNQYDDSTVQYDGATSGGGPVTPPAPTNLTATAGNAQILLAWDAVPTATYNLYRNIGHGGETLYVSGLTTNSYTDTGVVNGTLYCYTVTATKSAGGDTYDRSGVTYDTIYDTYDGTNTAESLQSNEACATPAGTPAPPVVATGHGPQGGSSGGGGPARRHREQRGNFTTTGGARLAEMQAEMQRLEFERSLRGESDTAEEEDEHLLIAAALTEYLG